MAGKPLIVGGDAWYPPKDEGFVYHADFPERYVREKSSRGWMECEACWKDFKLWMTHDKIWNFLPPELRRGRFCVPCFRQIVDIVQDPTPDERKLLRELARHVKMYREARR